jgi:hypothetical protein
MLCGTASATQRNKPSELKSNGEIKEIDLPVWFEFEGDTRAAEDPADCMRRLDFELVFILSWWVADRDKQFLAGGDRWCRGITNGWRGLHFERWLDFRSKYMHWSKSRIIRGLESLTIVLWILFWRRVRRCAIGTR